MFTEKLKKKKKTKQYIFLTVAGHMWQHWRIQLEGRCRATDHEYNGAQGRSCQSRGNQTTAARAPPTNLII